MSKTKQLLNLLDGLEKKEFDKIVKIYLQKEFGFKSIVFTDGKNDTGIDIKVFDFDGLKIQYQLTTQKSSSATELKLFQSKLLDDLKKAKVNYEQYDYKDKLIFFYSKPLSNERIRQFEKIAFKDFKINLEIIEANRIATEAENIIEIQSELYKIGELDKFNIDNSQFDNNLFYDLLSFGKPTEFKIQVIESFILQQFFIHKSLTKETIVNSCEEKFSVKENDVFYNKLLSRFLSEKIITKEKGTDIYTLTPQQNELLEKKNEQFELDKTIFLKDISSILYKYNQEEFIEEFVIELKQLYIENFNIDLTDALSNEDEFHISSVCKPFTRFIEKKINDKSKTNALSLELLKYCLNNKFIQKIAATKVYSTKIDNNRLQNYLNNQKKIFIDTAIALYSLCYYYKPKNSFSNFFYNATKNLLEYSHKENLKLFISERYIWEIQNHIKDAYRLIPFSQIPNFNRLGTSRNVFFNFYNYLLKEGEIDDKKGFAEFLSDFGFTENGSQNSFNSVIEYALSKTSILKQVMEKDYTIEDANRLFENAMIKFLRNKTNFARNCDSIMLEFLADNDVEIHPIQPVFLTWDKTFYEVHKKYIQNFPNSQNWLMLTPNKLVDVYALLKFSINSETVTENLLALISDDIIINTHSLVDTLAVILNPNDEVGLEYTRILASIREREINQVTSSELTPPENYEGEAVIDDIFFNLTNRYKDNTNTLNAFKAVFTKREFLDDVVKLLNKTIDDFYSTKQISKDIYIKFDTIVLADAK